MPHVSRTATDFDVARESGHLCIRMAATLENIDRADEQVSAFVDELPAAVDRFAVRILLREAVLNAVVHGSGQDARQVVQVEASTDDDGLVITVADDGPGFVWHDRDCSFDITGDGGRGLALMQMYASEVTFNERGNRVTLRRPYAPGPQASSQ